MSSKKTKKIVKIIDYSLGYDMLAIGSIEKEKLNNITQILHIFQLDLFCFGNNFKDNSKLWQVF